MIRAAIKSFFVKVDTKFLSQTFLEHMGWFFDVFVFPQHSQNDILKSLRKQNSEITFHYLI